MSRRPVPTSTGHCMYRHARHHQHFARVRGLLRIKKLEDCFGQFLVRVVYDCGASREIEPEALARLVGWRITLKELRCGCGDCDAMR